MPPLITVCIPTFNRASLLKECVVSVLQQDYPNFEVIVSDNASVDETPRVMAQFPRIHYKRNPQNLGMVGNWNAALTMAKGELAIMFSDDDVMLPSALRTYAALMDNSNVEIAYSSVEVVDAHGRSYGISQLGPALESGLSFVSNTLWQRRAFYPSALIFRVESARAIGCYPDIGNQCDVAFGIALAMRRPESKVACCSAPLVRYMMHGNSLTFDPMLQLESRLKFEEWVISAFSHGSLEARLSLFGLFMMFRKLTGSRAETVKLQENVREAITKGLRGDSLSFRRRLERALSSRSRLSPLLLPELLAPYTLRWLNNRRFRWRDPLWRELLRAPWSQS